MFWMEINVQSRFSLYTRVMSDITMPENVCALNALFYFRFYFQLSSRFIRMRWNTME